MVESHPCAFNAILSCVIWWGIRLAVNPNQRVTGYLLIYWLETLPTVKSSVMTLSQPDWLAIVKVGVFVDEE